MKFLSLLSMLFLISCASSDRALLKKGGDQNYLMASTLWVQTAAEMRALQYQAFNIARDYLNKDLRKKSSKKRAIVVDIDETVVDNSPYQSRNILINKSYNSKSWGQWVDLAQAEAIPGALEFINYAAKRGVKTFYISNRKVRGFDATLRNLKKLGFPVTKEQLLLRDKVKDKTPRRAVVTKDHRVVLLMGDNLGDFAEVFQNKTVKERFKVTDEYKEEFGRRFIVLPNPMYGDWESAIHKGSDRGDLEQVQKDRIKNLRTYDL